MSAKAACLVCLFLLVPGLFGFSQQLHFEGPVQDAYQLGLNLRCAEALGKVSAVRSVESDYVASLTEAIELLITEDHATFAAYETRFHKRLDQYQDDSPHSRFLQAEIRLHWAFVYVKFGYELDAAIHLRQAYRISMACREKFPEYQPIRKTTGLIGIIVGSVPDRYSWVLGLLNMRGSVSRGLADLSMLADSGSPLALEAKLLKSLVQAFILSEAPAALVSMEKIVQQEKNNPLALFFLASLALKNSENELALRMLDNLADANRGIPLYYSDYLKGEAFLHKGDYLNAISAYRWFIDHQRGENYIKDAWYKIGLCYWLNGREAEALAIFEEARQRGREATEADKSAAAALAERNPPNIGLSKVRYFTDGGYYRQAEQLLAGMSAMELPHKKDQAEYYYRKARLAHKMNKPEATDFYLQTIEIAAQENWYFAPSACLQLGYIYQSQRRITEAGEYFQKALSYRRHAYKNSIDSKARSALAQLGRI